MTGRRVARRGWWAVAAVVFPVVVAHEAAGQDDTPALTIEPAAELRDDQQVTVTATGFSDHFGFVLQQCPDDEIPFPGDPVFRDDCEDLAVSIEELPAPTQRVRRLITTGRGVVDCAVSPCSVVLGGSGIFGPLLEVAAAPISFDPSPGVTLRPASNLDGGDEVEVAVYGVAANADSTASVVQCVVETAGAAPPASPGTCTELGDPPTVPFDRLVELTAVRREIPGAGGPVDCGPNDCVLGVRIDGPSGVEYWYAPVELRLAARLTSQPAAPHRAGDVVQVLVEGIDIAGIDVEVRQCVAALLVGPIEPADRACIATGAGPLAPPESTLAVDATLERFVRVDDRVTDCRVSDCVLAAVVRSSMSTNVDYLQVIAGEPLTFVVEPGIAVTPSIELWDRDVVRVRGSDLPGGARQTVQCVGASPAPENCVALDSAAEVAATTIDTEVAVRRTLAVGEGVNVDCGTSTCSLAVSVIDGSGRSQIVAADPIGFSAATLDISPRHGLADGELVMVDATGLVRGGVVGTLQCATSVIARADAAPTMSSFPGCVALDFLFLGPDPLERYEATVPVTTAFTAEGTSYDCTAISCSIVVIVDGVFPDGPYDQRLYEPISFASPRAITVTPTSGLVDRQVVEVTAHGLAPGQLAAVFVCGGTDRGRLGCGQIGTVESPFDGAFAGTVEVRDAFSTADDDVDCRSGPCGIGVAVFDAAGGVQIVDAIGTLIAW